MKSISTDKAKSAINDFLRSQIDKKTEKEQKQLIKAREDNDHAKISELVEKIADVETKFQADTWLANAVNKMAKQLKFGTHISKGIHPDAKGDNVSFQPSTTYINNLPPHVVGSHSVRSQFIDANGNAAALPLASFFDFPVNEQQKIKDLILADDSDFITSLAKDTEQAQAYHQAFKSALLNKVDEPSSHERNKQTLWVHNPYSAQRVGEFNYTVIVPLYPSVFTFEVYQKINHLRYSDANKLARDNRYKKTAEQIPYVSMLDLATVQLGGTKPQNVSMLMSKQGGRNYLLPSLPPPSISRSIENSKHFLPSRFTDSIFRGKQLKYQCLKEVKRVFCVVNDNRNNVDIRDKRKEALDAVLHVIFTLAEYMRTELPAGWSKDYELDMTQKYWLDPMRIELEGEEDFATERAKEEWISTVIDDFASWMNALLIAEFPKYKADFSAPEHREWEREIEDMKKKYERASKGVFL